MLKVTSFPWSGLLTQASVTSGWYEQRKDPGPSTPFLCLGAGAVQVVPTTPACLIQDVGDQREDFGVRAGAQCCELRKQLRKRHRLYFRSTRAQVRRLAAVLSTAARACRWRGPWSQGWPRCVGRASRQQAAFSFSFPSVGEEFPFGLSWACESG